MQSIVNGFLPLQLKALKAFNDAFQGFSELPGK